MEASQILKLLPEYFRAPLQSGNVRDTLLEIMEAAHAGPEMVLAELDSYFDPRRAPDPFVWMLARWMGLGVYLNQHDWRQNGKRGRVAINPAALRALTEAASLLARHRGTAGTLIKFLELATGEIGFAVDDAPMATDGRPIPFHVRVDAPAAARAQGRLVELVIEHEKPAFTTAELRWV